MNWESMVSHLSGKPLPPLPPIPGRVHVLATEADAFTPDDHEALLMSNCTDLEVGRVLGVSRQRANQLRQALRERLVNEVIGDDRGGTMKTSPVRAGNRRPPSRLLTVNGKGERVRADSSVETHGAA